MEALAFRKRGRQVCEVGEWLAPQDTCLSWRGGMQHSPLGTSVLSSVTWVQGERPAPRAAQRLPRAVPVPGVPPLLGDTALLPVSPCQGSFRLSFRRTNPPSKQRKTVLTAEEAGSRRRSQPSCWDRGSRMESVALYSFQATESDELAFNKGDTLKVGWSERAEWAPHGTGRLRTRVPGQFPPPPPKKESIQSLEAGPSFSSCRDKASRKWEVVMTPPVGPR